MYILPGAPGISRNASAGIDISGIVVYLKKGKKDPSLITMVFKPRKRNVHDPGFSHLGYDFVPEWRNDLAGQLLCGHLVGGSGGQVRSFF